MSVHPFNFFFFFFTINVIIRSSDMSQVVFIGSNTDGLQVRSHIDLIHSCDMYHYIL